ncbi:hypothetical protein [Amycolatopsis granulosa]|uniref:hypothetical protein n=1 Tax=Amycolatopsis granulosa TaxID=185684 RepID=UPI00312CAD00|nr:hypothetical protein [Amycolatopsis granulosa]
MREQWHRTVDLGRVGGTWCATVRCTGFDAAVNARTGLRQGKPLRHPAVRTLLAREARIEAGGWPLCAGRGMLAAGPVTVRCERDALAVLG